MFISLTPSFYVNQTKERTVGFQAGAPSPNKEDLCVCVCVCSFISHPFSVWPQAPLFQNTDTCVYRRPSPKPDCRAEKLQRGCLDKNVNTDGKTSHEQRRSPSFPQERHHTEGIDPTEDTHVIPIRTLPILFPYTRTLGLGRILVCFANYRPQVYRYGKMTNRKTRESEIMRVLSAS